MPRRTYLGFLAVAALAAAVAVPGAAARSNRPATVAKVYEAFSYHGVVIPHSQVESGYCTGSSTITPRVDAWHCVAGTTTLDPCFSSEFANGVVCPTPWTDTATEITLTRPLPKATNDVGPSLQLQPWAIQLASGAGCIYAPTSARIHGYRLNYQCSAKLSLWGTPNRRHKTWTILSAPPTATTLTRHSSILHAWM